MHGAGLCAEPIYKDTNNKLALRYDTETITNGVGLYEIANTTAGTITLAASAVLAHWANTTKYPGTVITEDTVQSYNTGTQEYGHAKYMHMVPTMNALYNHVNDTTKHGAGRYTAEATPLYRDNTTLRISSATTTLAGVIRLTSSVVNDATVVPTAQAVYNALANAGQYGSGTIIIPSYGSGCMPTPSYGGGPTTGNSGTVGSAGGWLIVCIYFNSYGSGEVGIRINNNYMPLANLSQGQVTVPVPLPPNATWAIDDTSDRATVTCYLC